MASAQISETIRPAYLWNGTEWIQIGDGGATGGGSELTLTPGDNIQIDYNLDLTEATISSSGEYTNIDSISTPDFIEFNTTPSLTTASVGGLYWDTDMGTLSLNMTDDTILQIGQEEHYPPVINTSGVQINNGELVMATGVQGDKLTIAKAVTDGSVGFDYIIGFATRNIPDSDDAGHIIKFGYVGNVDTQSYPVGTILYANPAVPGGLTSTKPDAPAYRVPIAIVVVQGSNSNNGRLLVRMSPASALGETDSNVKFTNLQNEDLLIYNSASSLWINNPVQEYITTASAAAASYTDSELTKYGVGGLLVSYGSGSPTFVGTQEEIYYDVNEELTQLNDVYVYYNDAWRVFNESEFTWDGLSLETWQWLLDNSSAEGWEWLINYDGKIGDIDYRMRYVPNLIADIKYATKTELQNLDIPTAVEYQPEQPDTSALEAGALWVDSDSTQGTGLDVQTYIRWTKTLSASASTFSGLDDTANTLSYRPYLEQVYINGTLLVRDTDYTATTGTSIVLTEPAISGDVIEILSFEPFVTSNTYSKTQIDSKFVTNTSASSTYVAKSDTELVKYGSTEPTSPAEGTIWIDSTNILKPITKVYNGSTWIIASGAAEAAIHPFFLAGI